MAIYPLLPGALLYETRTERGHRFRVTRLLGQGGFGITYLADDLEFGGPCVIKEFALGAFCARNETTGSVTAAPGHETEYQRWLDRFEREAQAIHRIRHPNVVGVRASWRERGTAYYAMDLVHGAEELPSPDEDGWKAMQWARAERIARGLLSALAAIHDQGMVHGDIKPSNVLLDTNERPVVIDFGTVRAQADPARTVTGAVFTPGYAPPELTNRTDLREAGPWSDLYSWAMVVWGLVAPHPSPDGRPLDATTRHIVASSGGVDRYALPATLLQSAGVPDVWIHVLVGCLQLSVSSRPHSVGVVLSALQPAASAAPFVAPSSAPTTAGPTGPTLVASKLPVRGRTLVERVSAEQRAVVEEDDESLDTLTSKSNSKAFVWLGIVAAIAAVAAVIAFALPEGGPSTGTAPTPVAAPAPTPVAAVVSPPASTPTQAPAAVAPPPAVPVSPPPAPAARRTIPADMVRIAATTFSMGSPVFEEGRDDDEQQRQVTITRSFWMQRTEVTQAQWKQYSGGINPSRFQYCGDSCPVEQVDWFAAAAYANARSRAEGLSPCYFLPPCANAWQGGATSCDYTSNVRLSVASPYACEGYRLPTEAEWELAARGGTTRATYAGNLQMLGESNAPPLGRIARYRGNSGVDSFGAQDCSQWIEREVWASACGTGPVAQLQPNNFGLHDMLGNVWEWTSDWPGEYWPLSSTDPWQAFPGENRHRIMRGGSWSHEASRNRAAYRGKGLSPGLGDGNRGLRLVRTEF